MSSTMDQPNLISEIGILSSPENDTWEPRLPEGSFYKTIVSDLNKHLEMFGDWNLFNNCINNDVFRASQFEPTAKKFSVIFSRLGLTRGGTIHLAVGNHNFTYSACAGAWILGARTSCGGVDLDSKGTAYKLEDTEASIVLVLPSTAEDVFEAIQMMNTKSKIHVLSFGPAEGCENILELLEEVDEADAPVPVDAVDVKTDTTVIFWSSGTTGLPKGVCHSHFSILNILGSLQDLIKPHSTMVATTCFFHVGGFTTGINTLIKHQTYYHMFGDGYSLELLLETVRRVKPRTLTMGSHHYVQLCESEVLQTINSGDYDDVKIIFPAGSSVPITCEAKIRKKFTHLKAVLNIFGQTECGICIMGTTQSKLGTILPKVQVKIESPESGELCKPGHIGEICVKNEYSMLRYLKRPKQTKEYFDSDGFAHTGDLGFYDENGEIFFVDRMKELIKYKNAHIAPTELEELLMSHHAVQDCLIFGRKDAKVQELVTAVVVLKPNKLQVNEQELLTFFNVQVPDFKRIRGGIIFREKIPRNVIGKLLRREMRDWAEKQDSMSSWA